MTKRVREIKTRRKKRAARAKRMRRFFASVICIVCTLVLLVGITTISAKETYNTKTVIVGYGDSLWSLVSENCNGNKNIRRVIAEVRKINDIDGSHLDVGDSILIPIYG